MSKSKKILGWTLRILLAIGFLLASLGKLTNNAQVIEMFQNWGYPNGFHFIIGILELVLAILLLIPKTLKIAVVGIAIILTGALITHLINDPIGEIVRPLIFFSLLAGVYLIHLRGKK